MPLEKVSRKAIGELVGYVGQNPFVFAGTVAQNIAYGCEIATEKQVRRAAEMACIHDEIMMMPGGYRARVAERGQNLSGGQKQRIALARVFLKNPPILILDEGTSALDNTSERLVQKAINAARADRTVILVAHRLTTLRDADRILVFDDGRIVETGTYAELVRRGGVFAELVRSAEGHGPTPSAANRIDIERRGLGRRDEGRGRRGHAGRFRPTSAPDRRPLGIAGPVVSARREPGGLRVCLHRLGSARIVRRRIRRVPGAVEEPHDRPR